MKIIRVILPFFFIFFIFEIIFNFLNIRPANNSYGWLNAHDTYKDIIKEIEVNEYGTRDIVKNKRYKAPNIILLGDSQIELAQSSEKMPARILEEKLNKKYNVYSLGSWGWGNDQQLIILRKTINEIKPKYVILFFTLNDLENNHNHIGFKGEKPTFTVDKNNIHEPRNEFVKKILNQLWTYRVIYRLHLKQESKKYKNLINDEHFSKRKNCYEKNLITEKDLLRNHSEFEYLRTKYVETTKARNQNLLKIEDWEKDAFRLIITKNRYKPNDDKLFYFRDILSKQDYEQIFLTNYLLNKIQNLSKENNAKFILLNVINKNYFFKNDKNYSICLDGKVVNYSNKNFEKFLGKVFRGIDYIITYNIEKSIKEYDVFDGHLNYNLNQKIFELVSKKIKNHD
jgi:hypothetical protein